MLHDPTDAFFRGISSAPLRMVLGVTTMILGFLVSVLPSHWGNNLLESLFLLPFTTIFWWGGFGGFFFIGLCALVGMFAFLHAFVLERAPKLSFFGIFTCAAIYLAPTTFAGPQWEDPGSWPTSLAIYLGAATSYWLLPWLIAQWTARDQ